MHKSTGLRAALWVWLTLMVSPAFALNSYYLKIPTIDGESTAVGFEDQMRIESWSWGLKSAIAPVGSGGASGKLTFSDFAWNQGIDKSVTALFLGVAQGKAYPDAILSVVRSDGGTRPALFFEMDFGNVRLTSISMSGDGSETVSASLNYQQLDMRYRPRDAKGAYQGWTAGSFRFNTASANQAATFSGDPDVIFGLFESGGNVSLAALPVANVPEPMTWAMLSAGLMTIVLLPRRRRPRAPRC